MHDRPGYQTKVTPRKAAADRSNESVLYSLWDGPAGILLLLAIALLIMLFVQSQRHYELSRTTVAQNMDTSLKLALNGCSSITALAKMEDDDRANLSVVHQAYNLLNEFTRHQRTYAILHLKTA
ncbi:MAG: hypothetical protein FD169_2327 [Bacillota bacterium]|nr:MAG: hypothetical protein FD169_2327 [Bacillota bacterium]